LRIRFVVRRLALLLCVISLTACSSVPNVIKPYRIEIQQGNYVSQEMLAQLKLGMTREQVRYVLGTPLVADIFHADRWDYIYYRERPGKFEQRKISVHFDKEGRLERIGGDVVPAGAGGPAPAPAPAQAKPAPAENPEPAPQPETTSPEEKKERGFFGRMLEKIGL
jgi:outer membrane protein assembly factor BamE